jgi:hypothetical protein
VDDVGQRAEFLLETVDGGGLRLAQRLERDERLALPVVRLVDDAEGAGAEALLDDEPFRPGELEQGALPPRPLASPPSY